MIFLIERASSEPIGEEYKLLINWNDVRKSDNRPTNYCGIIEINSLEELPKDEFILYWDTECYHLQKSRSLGYEPDGRIILYDDYVE